MAIEVMAWNVLDAFSDEGRARDVVAAYYTPDKPEEVLFMASVLAYTAWIIPLYFAVAALLIWVGAIALQKINARYYPPRRHQGHI